MIQSKELTPVYRTALRRGGRLCWVILTMMSAVAVAAEDVNEQGRSLAQRVYERADGSDVSSRSVMALVEEGREPRIRQMYMYRLERGPQEKWTLIRFAAPADIDGVGMLTLDHPRAESDQWLFLPALNRSRRIPANRMGGQFVGSDLFYEDLRDREVEMDRHRYLGKDNLQGTECEMLESIPIAPDNSVYSKRISWIHPEALIPLRVDFYMGGQEKPSKRFTVHRIEKIQGYWTVMDSTMADLGSAHNTRIKVEKVIYDRDLPAELFVQKTLEDPTRESNYRP